MRQLNSLEINAISGGATPEVSQTFYQDCLIGMWIGLGTGLFTFGPSGAVVGMLVGYAASGTVSYLAGRMYND